MNSTQQASIKLLAHCLNEESSVSSFMPLAADDPEWKALYDELYAHKVFSLCDKWLGSAPLADEDLKARWKNDDYKVQFHCLRVMAAQAELCALLAKIGIDAVVMKGAAAAVNYPAPFLRAMGDIDLLVRRRDYDAACSLAEENGYILNNTDPNVTHHCAFIKNGIEIEIHRRPGSVPETNESLIALFEEGITNRQTASIGKFSFPVLPADLNGLVLLLHINQHLRAGLGLRQIIDWMTFASRELAGDGYDKLLRPLLTRLGLDRFAASVTALCRRYLGLEGDFPWADGIAEDVTDEFMEYIMSMGNFGSKADSGDRISSAYSRAKNPFRLISILQKSGLRHWDAAKKHALLRPFAWIRQGFVTLRDMKKNDIPLSKLKQLRASGEKNRELYEKLGLTSDNKMNTGVVD